MEQAERAQDPGELLDFGAESTGNVSVNRRRDSRGARALESLQRGTTTEEVVWLIEPRHRFIDTGESTQQESHHLLPVLLFVGKRSDTDIGWCHVSSHTELIGKQ